MIYLGIACSAIELEVLIGVIVATVSLEATPTPRLVIAAGACDGGEFGISYASCGAVENVIPVDVRIPDCPPSPIQVLTEITSRGGAR